MVAIQVLPLDPEIWPEEDGEHPAPVLRPVPERDWRPLPDRSTRIRRRRLGALIAVAGVLVSMAALVDVLVSGGETSPARPTDANRSAPITGDVYVVQPGDTLWTIAQRVAPGEDPRPVVAELRELVGGVELDAGDRVQIGDL